MSNDDIMGSAGATPASYSQLRQPPEQQPRTATGRALLQAAREAVLEPAVAKMLTSEGRPVLVALVSVEALERDIPAIEAEMYDLASNDGYHAGIADCKEHDPAHRAAAPDPVATPPDALLVKRLVDELVRDHNHDENWEEVWPVCHHVHGLIREARRFLEGAVASPAPLDPINVLILSWAIDLHAQAVPANEPVHDDGTCSDDCAGDIRARYIRLEGQPVAEDSE